jgi:RNA polymerase sigma-70 factor (ECF subfamily)
MALFKQSKSAIDKPTLPDEEIVARILRGEQQLLELLYDRYSARIFHKCLSLIKDREASKDCTHDIIVKVFMNLAKYKGTAAFSLWVHSITYNYCMDYLQKQKRMDFSEFAESELDGVANDDESLENKLLQDLKLTQLEIVFEKLNPDDKMLLMMRYQDGMSVRDISESLGVGESAIKMRLKRSRDRLGDLIIDLEKKER